jgi:hypothetical protein
MELKTDNQIRSKKELSQDAISLALSGEWERAAVVNQAILDQTPDDVEAMNRLGKALMEIGEYRSARDVLVRVVSASPYNNIAKKNLARLDQIESGPPSTRPSRKAAGAPKFFIEESGKSDTTVLQKPGAGAVVASIAPGDPVSLAVENNAILVNVNDGEYLGRVEPKLGRRLIQLMEGGNKYEAAVIGVKEQGVAIIIRETYRHPSQHNVCSFPSKNSGENRVYLGENLMHYIGENDLEDDDEEAVILDESSDDESEWDE